MGIKNEQDIVTEEIQLCYSEAPFDKAKKSLEELGYDIISLEENARARIYKHLNSDICRYANYTKEGFVHIPKKGIYLVKDSPILNEPQKATENHRKMQEYFLTNEQSSMALENSVQIPSDPYSIPANRFGEDKITNFCFGDVAKKYGEFLRNAGINEMLIRMVSQNYIDKQNSSFARQMWFKGFSFSDRSELHGLTTNLHYHYLMLGVKKE